MRSIAPRCLPWLPLSLWLSFLRISCAQLLVALTMTPLLSLSLWLSLLYFLPVDAVLADPQLLAACLCCGCEYIYMVAAWGAYTFVLNMIWYVLGTGAPSSSRWLACSRCSLWSSWARWVCSSGCSCCASGALQGEEQDEPARVRQVPLQRHLRCLRGRLPATGPLPASWFCGPSVCARARSVRVAHPHGTRLLTIWRSTHP